MRRGGVVIGRVAIGAAALFLLSIKPARAEVTPVGRWITQEGQAIVEIAPCGAALCGALRRILKPEPGAPATDVHIPDPRLRRRLVLGMPFLTGFRRDGGRWKGSIYDLRSGKTYKSFLTLNPDGALALSGCLWLFCQTQTWRPLHQ